MKKNGSIKQKIYEIRRSKGISQEKVATAIGIALNNYRKLERGKTVLINEEADPKGQLLCILAIPNLPSIDKV